MTSLPEVSLQLHFTRLQPFNLVFLVSLFIDCGPLTHADTLTQVPYARRNFATSSLPLGLHLVFFLGLHRLWPSFAYDSLTVFPLITHASRYASRLLLGVIMRHNSQMPYAMSHIATER